MGRVEMIYVCTYTHNSQIHKLNRATVNICAQALSGSLE